MPSSNFYPNECCVCKSRTTLRRCSRCQMVSYCGEDHQKYHWQFHKDICKVISDLTKQKGLSHLYEGSRGCSLSTWAETRKMMCVEVHSILGRDFQGIEALMLQYPRVCFVCYDARQNNLTNCPNCPLVSLCKEHQRSPRHDKLCRDIRICHALENEESKALEATKIMFESTFYYPPTFKKLPTSTAEYLDEVLKSRSNVSYKMKLEASMLIFYPLTIFGALQKLNITSSKLTIYIHLLDSYSIMQQFCEILFHLMPNLNDLTVITDCNKEVSSGEMSLCLMCTLNDKALTFQHYNAMDQFDNIDLAVFINLDPPGDSDWQYPPFVHLRHISNKFTCPLLLTTGREICLKRVRNFVKSVCQNQAVLFDGDNAFSSLSVIRYWEDYSVTKHSQFMLIIKASKNLNRTEDIVEVTDLVPVREIFQPTPEQILDRFYPGICHVCKTANATVSCTRCKMIFYCNEKHMKENQSEHKDICKVILGLLREKGTPHLFDKLQNTDRKLWLEAKVNFVKKAKIILNRDLLRFEKEMFLFPKTCFVCHESDLSVLKTCKCNVSLCKIHREDIEHKNLCKDFYFNIMFGRNKEKPQKQLVMLDNPRDKRLLSSMDKFITSYFLLKKSHSNKSTIQSSQKVIISEFASRPLTLAYTLEKLEVPVQSTIYIQILGAINEEYEHIAYWHSMFFSFTNLRGMFIDLIGIEISDIDEYKPKSTFHFRDHSLKETEFTFRKFKIRYEEFFKTDVFRKPDVIIAFNMNLHESNLGISECTWKETLAIISKMNVPFVITGMTEERARKDHEMVCSLLGKPINYEYFGKNPFASWMPERDFQTERLCYSNNYILAYKQFNAAKVAKTQLTSITDTSASRKSAVQVKKKNELGKIKTALAVGNSESETGKSQTKAEKSDSKAETDTTVKEKLIQEHLDLQRKNKMLKENLRLKEENKRLKNKMSNLNVKP